MRQYETFEITLQGPEPASDLAQIDLKAVFTFDEETIDVKGFYAGNGCYKVRFLPRKAGVYHWQVTGILQAEGEEVSEPAQPNAHGMVQVDGTNLRYEDGTWFSSFGTTVYALLHQSQDLIDETMRSLAEAPFNKIRLCVFPKWFFYDEVEPDLFPFEGNAEAGWNVHRPNPAFWDHLEARLRQLYEMGIQTDLILFHPYDNGHWGFDRMPREDNLVYLGYLLRRLAAFPYLWWSLSNEYDVTHSKTLEEWEEIEQFVADHDPYHHLLSMHQCIVPWDHSRKNITHVSYQTFQINRTAAWQNQFGKPVLIDECGYEGDLKYIWGNASGKEMTARFWRAMALGGYCMHSETFLDPENNVVFWGRGGKLKGESVSRIAFLRQIIESLPGPISPNLEGFTGLAGSNEAVYQETLNHIPEEFRAFPARILNMPEPDRTFHFLSQLEYNGRCEDDAFLWYLDIQACREKECKLPETGTYTIDVIDTWNMTRETVMSHAAGTITVELPGREYMAILATKEQEA